MADRRQFVVRGGLLVAAVTACAGLLAESTEPHDRPRPAAASQPPQPGIGLELPLRRGLMPSRGANLFAAPAPPPPPPRVEFAAQAPPPPVAPPLPFTLVGTFEAEAGEVIYYLGDADKVHAVRVGETVTGIYRLESAAGDRLELLYLPLDIKQTLAFGKTK